MTEHPRGPVLDALEILGEMGVGETADATARSRIAEYAASGEAAGEDLAWGMAVLADLALQFLELQTGVTRAAFVAGMRHATDPDPGDPV